MADLFTSGERLLLLDLKVSQSISLYNGLFGFRSFHILRFIMKALELTGHGVPWIVYTVWKLWKSYALSSTEVNSREQIINMYSHIMLGLLVDLIIIAILKISFKRARPFYNEGDLPLSASKIDSFSFPSGHATRAFMLYILLPAVNFSQSKDITFLVWAVLLAYSRVALGRHYLSDVVIGSIVGLFEGWLTLLIGSILLPS